MGKYFIIDGLNDRVCHQRMAGLGLAAIVALALLSTGCGKGKSSTIQASVPPPIEDTNPPLVAIVHAPQYPVAPVEVPTSPNGTPDLKAINQAYIGWIVQYRRRPKDLDEFIALSGMKFPPPPNGKKYIIDKNGFINFTDK